MGHITNAKGFRAGKVVPWDYDQHRFEGDGLTNILKFNVLVNYLRRKLRRYFRPSVMGLVFSHCKIRKYGNQFAVRLYAFNGLFDTYLRFLRSVTTMRPRKKNVLFTGRQRWKKRSQKPFYYYFYKLPAKFKSRYRPRLKLRRSLFRKRRIGYHGGRFGRSLANKTPLQLYKIYKDQSKINAWVGVAKRRGQPMITKKTYIALGHYLSNRLTFDFRNVFAPERVKFIVALVHLKFAHLSARVIGDYVHRRIRLGYRIPKIVHPLMAEARKNRNIKGLFIKFKGRYSRKPRSVVNKKVIRYGKIGFSTVHSKVDYAFKRFETKFGTCSIKVWLSTH